MTRKDKPMAYWSALMPRGQNVLGLSLTVTACINSPKVIWNTYLIVILKYYRYFGGVAKEEAIIHSGNCRSCCVRHSTERF